MPLNPLKHHYSMENTASVYDEEALTALQLAARTTGKVNEVIEAFNTLEGETTAHLKQQDESIPVKITDKVQEHITGGQFDKQIDKYAGELGAQMSSVEHALSARMDTFTSLPNGSTTGDAELMDARNSDVGDTHPNAGGMVRTNIKVMRARSVPDYVNEMNFYNLFEKKWANGSVHNGRSCITIHPGVKFPKPTAVKPIPGYQVQIVKCSTPDGSSEATIGYTSDEVLLRDDCFYRFTLTHESGSITLDEGTALVCREPYYFRDNHGNVLDDILPLMRHGGFDRNYSFPYILKDMTCMYTEGGVCFDKAVTLRCGGDAALAFHFYENNTISAGTYLTSLSWGAEITIPAGKFGVLYFRATSDRSRSVSVDDLKKIHFVDATDPDAKTANVSREPADPNYKGIAHGGYSNGGRYAPENTLPAIRLAKVNGFEYTEFDVRISADGIPVLCHDATVDRTSNGTGNVADMTLEELKALDFSVTCSVPKFAGTQIPTLEEAIITCKKAGIKIYMEVEPACVGHENVIVNLVHHYNMENAVTYISFSSDVLKNILALDKYATVGFLTSNATTGSVETVKALFTGYNGAFLNAKHNALPDEVLTLCKTEGIPVEVWTTDDVSLMSSFDPYIRGVTSNWKDYRTIRYENEMEGY